MSDTEDRRIHLKSKTSKSASESRIWLFLALFAATLAAVPLLTINGMVSTRGGGDSPFLLIRTYEMIQALRAGQFPARWMDGAAYGLGYPFFSFYAALPYYLAASLHLGGLGILCSIKLTQLMGFVAAAAGMYALARRWLGSSPAAALTAVAYTFAPFHLVNVYVRGDSLSEFYAFICYPLILLSLHRLFERPSAGRVAALALSYAALIVTHNISAMIFSPFVLLYALLLVFDRSLSKKQKRRAAALILPALALGFLLSSWYWLPALGELDAVQLGEAQTGGYFHYSTHFRSDDLVQPAVFFNYDPDAAPTPFATGLVQAALALLGAGALIWRGLRRRKIGAPGLLALLMLLVSTLMITPLSRPLWDHLPLLPLTQFPWRFLSVQAFAASIVIGRLAITLPRPKLAAGLIGVILLLTALLGLRPEPLHITEADITLERLALYEYFTANIGTTIQAEYLPRGVAPRPYTSEAMLSASVSPLPLTLEGELGETNLLEQSPQRERWQIDVASERARLAFHKLYFPGWQAQVDGRPVELETLPGLGYIGLRLESGSHEIILRFGDSPLRQKANLLTAAGVLLLLGLVAASRPWRELTRRHMGIGGAIVLALAVLSLLLHLFGPPVAPADSSDLTMDFIRQPFLHHNPEGVDFGAARLSAYTLSADRASAGDAVIVEINWTGVEENLEARVDLVLAVHEQLEEPYALATSTDVIPSDGGLTHHKIAVPAEAVRGIYFLRVSVIGPDGELRPRTAQGKYLGSTYLCPLRVTAYRPVAGDEPVLGRFGPRIALVEARVEPAAQNRLQVTLTWHCEAQIPANYGLSLRVYDAGGALLGQKDPRLPHGLYPTSMWQPGELLTERLVLALDDGQRAEQAQTLAVILYDFASPALAPVGIAYVPVKERPRNFDLPSMQTPLGLEFGAQMRLLGYDLAQSSDALTLTLYWQARQRMDTDYKIFVHLFNPLTEDIPVQDDAMPLRNSYPTRWWAEGEVVGDVILLPLTDVPAGEYRLALGVYDPATAERLSAIDGQGRLLPDGRLILERRITVP